MTSSNSSGSSKSLPSGLRWLHSLLYVIRLMIIAAVLAISVWTLVLYSLTPTLDEASFIHDIAQVSPTALNQVLKDHPKIWDKHQKPFALSWSQDHGRVMLRLSHPTAYMCHLLEKDPTLALSPPDASWSRVQKNRTVHEVMSPPTKTDRVCTEDGVLIRPNDVFVFNLM